MRSEKSFSPRQIERLGIFGGTFNPFHNGHLNSIKTVAKALKLDLVKVIPAYQSPSRQLPSGPDPIVRLEMVKAALQDMGPQFEVDEREVQRQGISYTIDTLESIREEFPQAEIYVIVGMDQFEMFDRWKDFDSLIKMAHLVVTSRPDTEMPATEENFPKGLLPHVAAFDGDRAELTAGQQIHFVQLDDIDVSGTEVRRLLRQEEDVSEYLPPGVLRYIRENKVYCSSGEKVGDYLGLTRFCTKVLIDKGAITPKAYDLRSKSAPSEFVLIASGTSTRHTAALAEHLSKAVKAEYLMFPQSVEGEREGRWVVLDYGSLIVHLFYDYVRIEYNIEELWQGVPDVTAP